MERLVQPFQYVSVKQAYEEGRFLIADDMGMFKTAQAVLVNNKVRSRRRRTPTLAVCPTSVREHWAREVREWGYPHGQEVLVLGAGNYRSDAPKARRSDWTVISYPLLSHIGANEPESLEPLLRAGFRHVVLDEVHNAKNPEAVRTQTIRRFAEKPDYLTLLSGSPIPNTISDVYMLMHFLDPGKYPLSEDRDVNREARLRFLSLYWEDPQAFKELMHRKMIRRMARDYVAARLPEVEERKISVPLAGPWLEVYESVRQQSLPLGRKMMQLEKALLDTELVDPSLAASRISASPKYDVVDRIVEEEAREGKVLIFTSLKEGVVDALVRRYARHGAIAITGDVNAAGERERLRVQFQRDPVTRVLIATSTMNEGVDLTAATAVVNLTIPLTPAEYQQRRKRTDRPGEIEKESLRAYDIIAEYPSDVHESLDEAKLAMLAGKQRVIDYLLSGIEVPREDLLAMSEPKRVPRLRRAIKSDNRIVLEYYLNWRGVGTEGALRRLKQRRERGNHSRISELYPNFSMAKNAADVYLPIISELCPQAPWLDLAGGPGMLGHFSQQPVHVVDIDEDQLRVGQRLKTGVHVAGSFSAVPYRDGTFGLIVCSLAFQMSEPKQERSAVLQEINRVSRPGAVTILTLPRGYLNDANREQFGASLRAYGFEPIKKYEGRDIGPSKLDVYVARKVTSHSPEVLDLTFSGDKVVRQ